MAINNQSITSPLVGSTGSTTRWCNVSCSGTVSGRTYRAEVKINGKTTIFKTGDIVASGPSISISMSYTDNELLTALNGASSLGWSALIKEYDGTILLDQNIIASKTATASINFSSSLRHTAISHTNAPCDLDGEARMNISWTRPSTHAGWRTRIRFYVGGTNVITYSGYSSASPISFTWDANEIVQLQNAMGGVSPNTITIHCETGWALASSNTYFSGYISSSQTNNLIKLFSAIKVRIGVAWLTKVVKVWLSTFWKTGVVKVWTGSSWKQSK